MVTRERDVRDGGSISTVRVGWGYGVDYTQRVLFLPVDGYHRASDEKSRREGDRRASRGEEERRRSVAESATDGDRGGGKVD